MTLPEASPSEKELSPADAELVTLPSTPLALAALDLVQGAESPAIANHSVRSYLFARLLAPHIGL